MRKSGRLASIHEDDSNEPTNTNTENSTSTPEASTSIKNKKFVPTIPTVRRKKVVDEESTESVPTAASTSSNSRQKDNNNHRKSLAARHQNQQPAIVSGPLSMGPAAMARSNSRISSSGSSSGGGGIFGARSLSRTSSSSNSALNSKPLSDSVPVDEEFGMECQDNSDNNLLKPIALSSSDHNSTGSNSISVENDKLFLFQLPPVLPTLLNHTPSSPSSSDLAEADRWPASAQGRYGKLRRYKSGRLVLILENGVEFLVSSSSESLKEAQTTNILAIDPEFGQSFNLGPVHQKFVCIPEFDKFQKL